jgi:5-methyltetrahydropteroyltriglutamate--homocysteine methyltransferase
MSSSAESPEAPEPSELLEQSERRPGQRQEPPSTGTPRAEVVGSLKRPARLIEANRRLYAPGHTAVHPEERAKGLDEVQAIADEEIPRLVQRQIEAGIDVVTDGELRRYMFLNSLFDGIEGFSTELSKARFRGADGSTIEYGIQFVTDRLRIVDRPADREAAFMAATTDHPFKVSFPAASFLGLPFNWRVGVNDHAYPTHRAMVEHVVEIERELVAGAVAAGARHLQFDFPTYPFLCDPDWCARMEKAGHAWDEVLELCLWADRAVVEAIPDGVRTGLHLCRGNNQGRYVAEGSLEPVAEAFFDLPYDSFLVEWEDRERMGDFGPLRHLPGGDSVVVLGLVSSKRAELERADDILALLDEAARYVAPDRLALSPQCGFASTIEGNDITESDQWAKLALVGDVAARYWG